MSELFNFKNWWNGGKFKSVSIRRIIRRIGDRWISRFNSRMRNDRMKRAVHSASLGAIYGTALMVIQTIPAGMIAIAMK
jgi:hypothetical protein